MLWGGLNLLAQAKDGKVSFIHSNNELRNYPIAYGMKVRNIAEAPGGVILVGTTNGLLTFSNNFERLEEIKFYRNIRRPGDKTVLVPTISCISIQTRIKPLISSVSPEA